MLILILTFLAVTIICWGLVVVYCCLSSYCCPTEKSPSDFNSIASWSPFLPSPSSGIYGHHHHPHQIHHIHQQPLKAPIISYIPSIFHHPAASQFQPQPFPTTQSTPSPPIRQTQTFRPLDNSPPPLPPRPYHQPPAARLISFHQPPRILIPPDAVYI